MGEHPGAFNLLRKNCRRARRLLSQFIIYKARANMRLVPHKFHTANGLLPCCAKSAGKANYAVFASSTLRGSKWAITETLILRRQ